MHPARVLGVFVLASLAAGGCAANDAMEDVGESAEAIRAAPVVKAPNIARIQIRRVASLEQEAAGFSADPSLTYARLAQDPTIYRGQRVDFAGLVYNVDVRNGQSVLQIQCARNELDALMHAVMRGLPRAEFGAVRPAPAITVQ